MLRNGFARFRTSRFRISPDLLQPTKPAALFVFLTPACMTWALKLSEQKIELPATGVAQNNGSFVLETVPSGQTRARNNTQSQGVTLKAEMDHAKRRVKWTENHCVIRGDNQWQCGYTFRDREVGGSNPLAPTN